MMRIPAHWPVFGICGFSGSGKTTLIEQLIPMLVQDGLAVAIVKHDAHRLMIDHTGKDSDRLFQSGASVFAHDSSQGFYRFAARPDLPLIAAIEWLMREHDLVLVEGHKQTDLPLKIWLRSPSDPQPPPASQMFHADLKPEDDRVGAAYALVKNGLRHCLLRAPLRVGILIGGRSSRMGQPKHLISLNGKSWVEHQVAALLPAVESICLLGAGDVPASLRHLVRLHDAPGKRGPVGGMIAAMRWDPSVDWLFVACDMPYLSTEAINWLLGQRIPGKWAVMPTDRCSNVFQPLFAWYDRRLRHSLQKLNRPMALAQHPKVLRPQIPKEHFRSCMNINSPPQ